MPEAGELLIEGKTKKIFEVVDQPERVIVEAKDDITAGDGAKHDVIEGKGVWATSTTVNVFNLLQYCSVPVAFAKRLDDRRFVAPRCEMIPLEVVVRREAHGSYLKRYPHLHRGTYFPRLVFELFLKTTGQRFGNTLLFPCDDPLFRPVGNRQFEAVDPKAPVSEWAAAIEPRDIGNGMSHLPDIERLAYRAFLILEKAWQLQGRRLVDIKFEFGLSPDGKLLLADVVDNDSWRVLDGAQHLDKQVYRDGGALDDVALRYKRVAELTEQFHVPRQQVILWMASRQDDVRPFEDAFRPFIGTTRLLFYVCSMHKEPERGILELHHMIQEVPDSVVIVCAGRSNGAGPVISAHTHVPVMTVPANYRDFPEDVWSSLRTPSATPCMTVLEPENAMLAAMQILASRNPALYADVRLEQESRMVNTIPLA